jgi:hypothetical protein
MSPHDIAIALNPYRIRAGLPQLIPPVPETRPETIDFSSTSIGPCIVTYSYGIPILEFRQMFGINNNDTPCFHGTIWDYWLQPSEHRWVGHSDVSPGYYEVSLVGHFHNLDWGSQETQIQRQFGPTYERASEHLICEAFFSAWLLNRNDRMPTSGQSREPSFLHWGKALNSRGERVWVSQSGIGITVNAQPDHQPRPDLAAAISKRLT